MTERRHITIFDTTLRDGEQSPGASMNLAEKLEVAQSLQELGVDVMEAGFPIASPGDFEAVRQIASSIHATTVCGLARCNAEDIDCARDALASAKRARIHVFLATSAIHREHKLRMSCDEIVQRAVAGVKRAVGYCGDVEFSPEDAVRTERDFLCRVVEAAIDAGARTVNIPDTVGYATPEQMGATIAMLMNRVPNMDKAVVSIHCHNDLGLAVANSLAAVASGAGQIECTVNGIGERAGNCSLEEVVMVMRTRNDVYPFDTGINTRALVPTSRLVSAVTGLQVQRNKAIVGQNAFAHEAGIHQDGMLKERTTYEIMRPEDVGITKTDLVLGKHSGRAALADRAKMLGFRLPEEKLQQVFDEFKKLADKKKKVYDGDIVALIEQQLHGVVQEHWKLVHYEIISRSGDTPHVKMTLKNGGKAIEKEVNMGDGPIDAAFRVVEQITGLALVCKDYQVSSATFGRDAQGEASLEIEHEGHSFRGLGVSTDTIEATIKALLNAVNRIAASQAVRCQDHPSP
ncbi:MAG: 2-isopropylmalate synthase [Planctomycetota bacterium]